jgi:dTMP kinase
MTKEGKLISLEGIDGSGKGTQSNKIKEYLESKGINVSIYHFPRYETLVGKQIARYLQGEFGDKDHVPHELVCIAYATDRFAAAKEIYMSLAKGEWVICDRYTYSNLFTAAKMPESEWEFFIDWIEHMEFNNLGVIKPDFNFYLYVDPQISIKRIQQRGLRDYQDGKKDIHESDPELLISTAKCYLNFAMNKLDWCIIDQMNGENQLSKEQVFEKIKQQLDKLI